MVIPYSVQSAIKTAAALFIFAIAAVLYVKGCSDQKDSAKTKHLKDQVSIQAQSIEISNKTHQKVQDGQQTIQARSDAAVRTILSGRSVRVQAAGRPDAPGRGSGAREGQPADVGGMAGDDGHDACDHACIMRVANEAYDVAERAACELRGKGPCDQPSQATKQP